MVVLNWIVLLLVVDGNVECLIWIDWLFECICLLFIVYFKKKFWMIGKVEYMRVFGFVCYDFVF